MIVTASIELQAQRNGQVLDVTSRVAQAVRALRAVLRRGGAVRDFQRLFDEIVAPNREYLHNLRWGDGNGHSDVRAALLGPSLTVPFVDRELMLGTWQQIVFVDFDNRSRQRRLVVQIMGE
jgi:secondary thiamine-phosphate synthase enzyme